MKTILYIIICFSLFACVDKEGQQKAKQVNKINPVLNDSLKAEEIIKPKTKEFDINKFQVETDSLLKALKGEKYFFELKSDTFNFNIDNPEIFTKGCGIFWRLYQDSTEKIVRHYLFDPKTRLKLRIYLAEVNYEKEEQLERVITRLETEKFYLESDASGRWRLSPTSDYVMISDKTLYWMNLSYPYSNNEVLRFIDCLQSNVDTTKFKGRIICLLGSDCKNKNVP